MDFYRFCRASSGFLPPATAGEEFCLIPQQASRESGIWATDQHGRYKIVENLLNVRILSLAPKDVHQTPERAHQGLEPAVTIFNTLDPKLSVDGQFFAIGLLSLLQLALTRE